MNQVGFKYPPTQSVCTHGADEALGMPLSVEGRDVVVHDGPATTAALWGKQLEVVVSVRERHREESGGTHQGDHCHVSVYSIQRCEKREVQRGVRGYTPGGPLSRQCI